MTHAAPKAPAHAYWVEVKLKAEFPDAEGAAALALLQSLGLTSLRQARSSRLYFLKGPLNAAHIQQAARDLLCDPVCQDFKIIPYGSPWPKNHYPWRVEVWLKDAVTDPAGESVSAAVSEMGLPALACSRTATAYHIAGHCGRNQLERAVPRCLANPVIHRFTISESSL